MKISLFKANVALIFVIAHTSIQASNKEIIDAIQKGACVDCKLGNIKILSNGTGDLKAIPNYCNLSDSSWDGAVINASGLTGADFSKASFNNTQITLSSGSKNIFNESRLSENSALGMFFCDECEFKSIQWPNAKFSTNVNIPGASFVGANLENAEFFSSKLKNADFSSPGSAVTNLNGAQFKNVILSGAKFHNSKLQKSIFIGNFDQFNGDISKDATNKARNPRGAVDFGADFSNADLTKSQFRTVNLTGANFNGADLNDAKFDDMSYKTANLSGAKNAPTTATL